MCDVLFRVPGANVRCRLRPESTDSCTNPGGWRAQTCATPLVPSGNLSRTANGSANVSASPPIMRRAVLNRGLIALATLFLPIVIVAQPRPALQGQPAHVDFVRDVRPIFEAHCFECHGPSQQMSGYRLDRRRDAMRISDGGTVIGPGNSAGSRLYLRITGAGYGAAMPPTGRLEPAQIETVRRWIDEGAEWPDAAAGDETPTTPDPRAARLMEVIRLGDRARFDALLAADSGAARLKG